MSMLTTFPGFAAFALTATVLCVHLLVVWNASGGVRARTKTTPNAEDPQTLGNQLRVTAEEAEPIARLIRVHRNALANIVPFLFLALVYTLLGAPANVAWGIFGVFTAARVLHLIVYTAAIQPWRTASYAVSQLALAALVAQIVRAAI